MPSEEDRKRGFRQDGNPVRGVIKVVCNDWLGFTNFVNTAIVGVPNAVFRGQADASWKLTPTLARKIDNLDLPGDPERLTESINERIASHLENFRYAIRGRRGSSPEPLQTNDDLWALGQHYGLATPLLDWTESPFVAAYFAFNSEESVDSEYAVVYALSRVVINRKLEKLMQDGEKVAEQLRFIRPYVDDNARLINQRGMFTICLADLCLRTWIEKQFPNGDEGNPLIEILIPRSDRLTALRSLNRMNINALTLFPDLTGSSEFCNKKFLDPKY